MARRRKKDAEVAAVDDMTTTAARVAAMLDRWEAEDVSDEPDWDIGDVEPIALSTIQRARQGTGPSS
jgi:hypothetical protein